MIDYSYTEIEDGIIEVFENPRIQGEEITTIENTYLYAECEEEPDMFLNHLKVIVYEVKHNILTQTMKDEFVYYLHEWGKGILQPEILPEDLPIIQNDIDYVRSVLKL